MSQRTHLLGLLSEDIQPLVLALARLGIHVELAAACAGGAAADVRHHIRRWAYALFLRRLGELYGLVHILHETLERGRLLARGRVLVPPRFRRLVGHRGEAECVPPLFSADDRWCVFA